MLDEKLNALIKKYGIYDVIGGHIESVETNDFWGKVRNYIRGFIGEICSVWELNKSLKQVKLGEKVALWIGKTTFVYYYLLTPENKKKIVCFIQDGKEMAVRKEFHGRPVIRSSNIGSYSLDAIACLTMDSSKCHLDLIGLNFAGKIIDMYQIRYKKGGFYQIRKRDPYVDIILSRHYLENEVEHEKKKVWQKQLIANYIRARDFLSTKKEIEKYVRNGYGDAKRYQSFWHEIEILLSNIKEEVRKRKQRDVFIFWLDQIGKDDFFSMRWAGNSRVGVVFHRAYTTMTHTTAVLQSIFTGENVKNKKFREMIDKRETCFRAGSEKPSYKLLVYSGCFNGKIKEKFLHKACRCYGSNTPASIWIWYVLDSLLTSLNQCVCFVHCMETHNDFSAGIINSKALCESLFNHQYIPLNQTKDYTEQARKSCEHLDLQLEWWHCFFPESAVSVYMSDHVRENNLVEKNINVPFKIIGKGIKHGNEYRLFSYKDMYKLVGNLLKAKDLDNIFSPEYVIIDQMDPYAKDYAKALKEEAWEDFILVKQEFDKAFLKRYLQATKVVTAEEEYYTINILGEETYYRDKECRLNLVDDPAYADRIKELREKAGKFYNPWKEKRQVAIDFYEYLGIKEEDIVAQCY